jgi:hypothetical protein
MRINGVACAASILVVSIWTSGVWAQAQTGAQPHGHDQTSTAQGATTEDGAQAGD